MLKDNWLIVVGLMLFAVLLALLIQNYLLIRSLLPTLSPSGSPVSVPPISTPTYTTAPSVLPTLSTIRPTSEPTGPLTEGASICVLAYHDRNGDALRDEETEELLPNAEFTLADASGVVDRYTSDGISEPYCFTRLAGGAYRVIQSLPPGYAPSGPAQWSVAVAEGTNLDIQFGSSRSEADGLWSLLVSLDEQAEKLDKWISDNNLVPEKPNPDECPFVSRIVPDACWIYRTSVGNKIVFKGYVSAIDLYVYDIGILKWDLGRDGQLDVLEYDTDGDGEVDLALADMDGSGSFEDDEIYIYEEDGRRWQPLVPGVLPFPLLPIFPY